MLDTIGMFVDSPESAFGACDVLVHY